MRKKTTASVKMMNIITSSAPLLCVHLRKLIQKNKKYKKIYKNPTKYSRVQFSVTLKMNKKQKIYLRHHTLFFLLKAKINAQHEETPCRHLYSFTHKYIFRSLYSAIQNDVASFLPLFYLFSPLRQFIYKREGNEWEDAC